MLNSCIENCIIRTDLKLVHCCWTKQVFCSTYKKVEIITTKMDCACVVSFDVSCLRVAGPVDCRKVMINKSLAPLKRRRGTVAPTIFGQC
jgi:hypothetical protein